MAERIANDYMQAHLHEIAEYYGRLMSEAEGTSDAEADQIAEEESRDSNEISGGPLMEPFTIIRAISTGLLNDSYGGVTPAAYASEPLQLSAQ